jgi:CheY-like chemotaxis protein
MRAVRVVLATENEALGVAVTHALAAEGVGVVCHGALLGLYAVLLKEEPDVVLLDGALPSLALEATAKFLRSKGAARRFPIVLLSSSSEDAPDPAKLAQTCAADDFIDRAAPPSQIARVAIRVAHKAGGGFDLIPDSGKHILPTAPGDAGRPAAEPAKPAALVVDDDVAIARMLKKILESSCHVTVVHDGQAAIDACAAQDFAVVFCDLAMPGVTGPEVYRSVLASNPALAARFVFVTAHSIDPKEIEFFMGLTNRIVHKPFTMREIVVAAQRMLAPSDT